MHHRAERLPLLWLSEVPWQGLPQRQHHLVRALREHWDVLYVEPPPPLRLPAPHIIQRDGIRVAQVAPILNVRQPTLQRLLGPASVRALAAHLATAQVRRLVRIAWPPGITLSRASSGLRVVCSNVYLTSAAAAVRPARLLLDVCDDPRAFPGVPPWTADVLATSVRLADVVTTSSRALEHELSALSRVHYIPNGVRPELLNTHQNSRDVVGYLGYIGPWLDFGLLESTADALDDLTFELVGPVDPAVMPSVARLERHPNICVRPAVPEASVPSVLATFSVSIIPFVRSPLTHAVNPNKLYEYAARDLPIVTTAFSPDLEPFASAVDVCPTPSAFIEAVRQRAHGEGLRSTRWIAEAHAWPAIAAEFAALLD